MKGMVPQTSSLTSNSKFILPTLFFIFIRLEVEAKVRGKSHNLRVGAKRVHEFGQVRHCTDVLGRDAMGTSPYRQNSSLSNEEEAAVRVFSRDVCAFVTRECIQPNRPYVLSTPAKALKPQYNVRLYGGGKRVTRIFTSADHAALPDIKHGSWGSCAFVVYSDHLADKMYGPIIDSHNTVVRIGLQSTKHFENSLGAKSHVIIVKPHRGRVVGTEAGGGKGVELRYYWMPSDAFTYGGPGRQREARMRARGERTMPALREGIERLHAFYDYTENWNLTNGALVPYPLSDQTNCLLEGLFNSVGVPTSGIRFLTRLLKSQFCKKIGVFGFSGKRGGTFFNKAERMAAWHNPKFELQVLQSWAEVSRGLLRIYT